jgi:hypothetical protein
VNELMQSSLQFPTVVFTIALGIALVYWLFVLLGALDLDLLGSGHPDFDVDVSGVHADVGDASGGHDAGGGHDADGDADADGGGVWTMLGLGTVPLTISISFILLVGWVGSLLAMHYLVGDSGIGKAILLPIVLILALPIAALLVKPLAPVFRIKEGKTNADYVGHVCTITTNSVDDTFGFANIEDGGSLVQISVRCDQSGKLARGDKALIIEFDPTRRTFVVEPSADMLPPATREEKS